MKQTSRLLLQKVKSLVTKPYKDPSQLLIRLNLRIQSIGIKFYNYKCEGINYKNLMKTTIERTRDEQGCHSYHIVA